MGLNDQSLFLLLAELLCQPHHLVGIIQSRVWLSCFTEYIAPGLITKFSMTGWLTVVSASTSSFLRGPIPFWEFIDPLFTILIQRFVGKKMRDRRNLSLHGLYRMRFPLKSWHDSLNSLYLVVELFEFYFLIFPSASCSPM
jgi:hypothetical protein